MTAQESPTMTFPTDRVQVLFTNGTGTVYQLDADLGNGHLAMARRDQAMAAAMLTLALENVRQAVTP